MQIFLSHSGERSRAVAEYFFKWLPKVSSSFTVWVDTEATEPGRLWLPKLDKGLGDSDVGIICITPENVAEPWPVAEFACLRNKDKIVVPYMIDGANQSNLPGPMKSTRAVADKKEDTWRMLQSLAQGCPSGKSPADLRENFEREWPDLEKFLAELGPNPVKADKVLLVNSRLTRLALFISLLEITRHTPAWIRVTSSIKPMAAKFALALGLFLVAGFGALAVPPLGKWVAQAMTTTSAGARDWLNKEYVPQAVAGNFTPNTVVHELSFQVTTATNRIQELTEINTQLAVQQFNGIDHVNSNAIPLWLQQQMNLAAAGKTTLLGAQSSLPPEWVNLASVTSDRHFQPQVNDWLLFIAKNPEIPVMLYSDPDKQDQVVNTLPFGRTLKVVAVSGRSLKLQIHQQSQCWLRDWEVGGNYTTLRIPAAGLSIPGWQFLKTPSAGASPSERPAPATPQNFRIEAVF